MPSGKANIAAITLLLDESFSVSVISPKESCWDKFPGLTSKFIEVSSMRPDFAKVGDQANQQKNAVSSQVPMFFLNCSSIFLSYRGPVNYIPKC